MLQNLQDLNRVRGYSDFYPCLPCPSPSWRMIVFLHSDVNNWALTASAKGMWECMACNLDGFWRDSTLVARIILLSLITSPLQTRLCASRGTNLILHLLGCLLVCVLFCTCGLQQQVHLGHRLFPLRDCDQHGKEWKDSLPEIKLLFHLNSRNTNQQAAYASMSLILKCNTGNVYEPGEYMIWIYGDIWTGDWSPE